MGGKRVRVRVREKERETETEKERKGKPGITGYFQLLTTEVQCTHLW